MENHYSILKYINNPLSNESIAIGLIVVSQDRVFFKISNEKLDVVKKINPNTFKLLEFSLRQFIKFIDQNYKDESYSLIKSKKELSESFLKRLSIYNNGILQFSTPSLINQSIDEKSFFQYFNKFIGVEKPNNFEAKKISSLCEVIQKGLYKPLENKIDVNYTIKKKQLDSLFFDYHIDGIGVNGSMYASKAIDLNSSRTLSNIKSDISEFESVIERLNRFAERKGLSNDHKYYLIVDPYEGKVPSYNDLYSLLKSDIMPLFKIISSANLSVFVDQVISNKARKFSEEFLLEVC